MNKAQVGHLLYWLCFGVGAACIYFSFTLGPSLPALVGVMAFAFLTVLAFGGLLRTWDLMTEHE